MGRAYIYFNYGGLRDSVWIRNVKPNLLFSNSPNVMLEPNKSKDVAIYALFGFVPRIGVNLFEVTNQVKWTVSDESVATISADGHIIAHAIGKTTITATFYGVSTTINVV
ncbi:Ig-like domain-containing protein [Bacillus sp. JJ664]